MKLIWKILAKPANRWVKVINEKYLKIHVHFLKYKKTLNTSWRLAKLMEFIKVFKKEIIWRVGEGSSIDF